MLEPGFWILTKGVKRQPVWGQPQPYYTEVLGMEQPSTHTKLKFFFRIKNLLQIFFWLSLRTLIMVLISLLKLKFSVISFSWGPSDQKSSLLNLGF